MEWSSVLESCGWVFLSKVTPEGVGTAGIRKITGEKAVFHRREGKGGFQIRKLRVAWAAFPKKGGLLCNG